MKELALLSVHWPIIRRCLMNPGAVAVVDDQRTWRRLEILAAAFMLADEIEARSKTRTVAFMLPASGAGAVAALAAWILGRTVVPLNFLLKREELEYVVKDCGTDLIVTAGPMLDFVGYQPEGAQVFRLETMAKAVPTPRWPTLNHADDLALLLYTSGTSGRPKGVMLSHGNITANIGQCTAWADLKADDVVLGVLPQFHSFGLTVLTLLPLTVGFKAVYTARFIPGKIVRLFREHRPSLFIGIPSMFNALLHSKDAGPDDFARCKYVVSGGEPLPQAVFDGFRERFGVTINEGYGLTETSPVTNWCRPDEFRRGSVGRALPGVEQRIVSIETGEELGAEQDGEIRTRGPNLMKGYLNKPEESAAAIDEQGYLRTGDIGRMDGDGHLFITGRLKEMLIIGGENVFPREIEEVLNSHPSVKESGVIGRIDPVRGELPVAFVELKEGQSFDETAVRSFCRQRLAGYKVPSEVRVLPALPRNPTGKVMRRELKKLL
jgi:long-chain acyl-CoA synthetase